MARYDNNYSTNYYNPIFSQVTAQNAKRPLCRTAITHVHSSPMLLLIIVYARQRRCGRFCSCSMLVVKAEDGSTRETTPVANGGEEAPQNLRDPTWHYQSRLQGVASMISAQYCWSGLRSILFHLSSVISLPSGAPCFNSEKKVIAASYLVRTIYYSALFRRSPHRSESQRQAGGEEE